MKGLEFFITFLNLNSVIGWVGFFFEGGGSKYKFSKTLNKH